MESQWPKMADEVTLLVLREDGLPGDLARALAQTGAFVEETTAAGFADAVRLITPDLVVVYGGARVGAVLYRLAASGLAIRVAVIAKTLPPLPGTSMATVEHVPVDLPPVAMARRLAALARRSPREARRLKHTIGNPKNLTARSQTRLSAAAENRFLSTSPAQSDEQPGSWPLAARVQEARDWYELWQDKVQADVDDREVPTPRILSSAMLDHVVRTAFGRKLQASDSRDVARVVLIDDDMARADLIADELRHQGLNVMLASPHHTEARWPALRRFSPHAIIVDERSLFKGGRPIVGAFRRDPFLQHVRLVPLCLDGLYDEQADQVDVSSILPLVAQLGATESKMLDQLDRSEPQTVYFADVLPHRLLNLLAEHKVTCTLECRSGGTTLRWLLAGGLATEATLLNEANNERAVIPPDQALLWLAQQARGAVDIAHHAQPSSASSVALAPIVGRITRDTEPPAEHSVIADILSLKNAFLLEPESPSTNAASTASSHPVADGERCVPLASQSSADFPAPPASHRASHGDDIELPQAVPVASRSLPLADLISDFTDKALRVARSLSQRVTAKVQDFWGGLPLAQYRSRAPWGRIFAGVLGTACLVTFLTFAGSEERERTASGLNADTLEPSAPKVSIREASALEPSRLEPSAKEVSIREASAEEDASPSSPSKANTLVGSANVPGPGDTQLEFPPPSMWQVPAEQTVPPCSDLVDQATARWPHWRASLDWKNAKQALISGHLERAHHLLCRAATIDATSPATPRLVRYYLSHRSLDQAEIWIQKMLEVDAGRREALELLSDVRNQQGRLEEARFLLLQTMRLVGSEGETLALVAAKLVRNGRAALSGGDLSQAEQAVRRAVLLEPKDPLSAASLAEILLRAGRIDAGAEWASWARTLDPGVGLALFVLAEVARSKQRYDQARRYYLEVKPGDSYFKPAQASLKEMTAAL